MSHGYLLFQAELCSPSLNLHTEVLTSSTSECNGIGISNDEVMLESRGPSIQRD